MADNMFALPEEFKTEVFKNLIDQAPSVYVDSKARVEKAVAAGEYWLKLVDEQTAKDGRITDELDLKLNEYLVKIKAAHKNINEQRIPITTFIATIPKLYTTLENLIDITKPETVPAKVQIARNKLATYKIQEQKKAEEARQRAVAVEKEKISISSTIEIQLNQYFNEYLSTKKKNIISRFESVTLESAKEFEKTLNEFKPAYPRKHYDEFKPVITSTLLSEDDIRLITVNVTSDKFTNFADEYRLTLTELKEDKLNLLPSKYRALEEIAAANEEEKLRLQKIEDERIAADKLKEQQALELRNKAVELQVETNATELEVNTLFDSQANITTEAPKVKESVSITVLHAAGYKLLLAKYFEEEGINEMVDNLNKKTFLQVKTFCEKLSLKTGEEIKSQYLRYEEVYKAKNVK
jgi:hypothetical protein